MNRKELVDAIVKQTGTTKVAANEFLDAFIETVEKSVTKGNNVTLVGFGTFAVSKRKARNVRNPQTGKTMKIAAKNVPVFRAGKGFKERVAKVKK